MNMISRLAMAWERGLRVAFGWCFSFVVCFWVSSTSGSLLEGSLVQILLCSFGVGSARLR